MKKVTTSLAGLSILWSLLLSGCTGQVVLTAVPVLAQGIEPQVETASPTPTRVPTSTPLPTATFTATSTATPLPSFTPTNLPTMTPTETATPTPEFPQAVVREQANCRYGPGKAYLYSHGMYSGDRVEIHGRSYSGTWLWIKPENLPRHCWSAASVLEITGDITRLKLAITTLPHSTLYGPPQNVQAYRDGDRVLVEWDAVWMTLDDDRGYLIEATVCQNGNLIPVAVHTDKPGYEFTDERGCNGGSSGILYTVEKHGYTDPVKIPWP